MGFKMFLAAMSMKVKIIVVCAAIAVAGGITAVVLTTASKVDTYRVLKVFELTGSAVVTRQGAGDIDAYVGMNLESGDMLTVCDGSVLRIYMDGDKYMLLDGGTVLELIAEGNPSDSRTSIKLKEGTILNELTTSLSANSSYEVATPKATMAVRGTSFMVSVELNEDGSYNIRTDTFHGKVEVMLLDPEGMPAGKSAIVPEDKGVVIRTEPNSETGNPAEVDGTSFFVYEIEEGVFVEFPKDGDPVSDIVYEYVADVVKEYALRSNDDGTMVLDEYIVSKLGGYSAYGSVSVTAVSATETDTESTTTTASVSENDAVTTTSAAETSVSAEAATTTVLQAEDSAEAATTTTTVPQTEDSAEAAITTVPQTEDSAEAATTTVPKTEDSAEAATTTVPKTEDSAEAATTTVPKTEDSTRATTTTVPRTTSNMSSITTTSKAIEEAEYCTVSFISDGQLIYQWEAENGGTLTTIPTVPAKTGYTGKWTYNGAEFTEKAIITGNITVKAEYTLIEYTVTFKANSSVWYNCNGYSRCSRKYGSYGQVDVQQCGVHNGSGYHRRYAC